jgi:hypothetical protein
MEKLLNNKETSHETSGKTVHTQELFLSESKDKTCLDLAERRKSLTLVNKILTSFIHLNDKI